MAHSTDDSTDEVLGRFLSAEAERLAGQAIPVERMTARVRATAKEPRAMRAPIVLLAATLAVAGMIGGLIIAGGRSDHDRTVPTPSAVAVPPTPTTTPATPSQGPTPTQQPPIVNVPAGLHPRMTPADVQRLVLARIAADERRRAGVLRRPGSSPSIWSRPASTGKAFPTTSCTGPSRRTAPM